jgi:proton glutamate symport protein
MIGMIVCSLAFGLAIAVIGDDADIVLNFFQAISKIMMCITNWVVRMTPIAVLFLIAGEVRVFLKSLLIQEPLL